MKTQESLNSLLNGDPINKRLFEMVRPELKRRAETKDSKNIES